jgi:hypothetical protein
MIAANAGRFPPVFRCYKVFHVDRASGAMVILS